MEKLSNISDMYNGQIIYYYSKFYFIKEQLETYTVEFNKYINNNYYYDEEVINLNSNKNNSSENNSSSENKDYNNIPKSDINFNKTLIVTNKNKEILKTNNIIKNYRYPKTSDKTQNKESNNITDYKKVILNKLYRRIARKCHPDKVCDNLLNFYFIEAQKGLKDKNISYLLFLMNKSKIDYNIDNLIIFIQEELTILEQNIKTMTNKIEWKWGSINNIEFKKLLINNYVSIKKLKKK